jgi:hypothetical protein
MDQAMARAEQARADREASAQVTTGVSLVKDERAIRMATRWRKMRAAPLVTGDVELCGSVDRHDFGFSTEGLARMRCWTAVILHHDHMVPLVAWSR